MIILVDLMKTGCVVFGYISRLVETIKLVRCHRKHNDKTDDMSKCIRDATTIITMFILSYLFIGSNIKCKQRPNYLIDLHFACAQ